MKIELEAEELFSMRDDLRKAKDEIQKLEDELKDLDSKRLREIVIHNSFHLANKYLAAIFNKLGFQNEQDSYYDRTLSKECNFNHWVGDDWYMNLDKIDVSVNVDITEKFRKVFLRLGVVETQKEEDKKIDFLKEIE